MSARRTPVDVLRLVRTDMCLNLKQTLVFPLSLTLHTSSGILIHQINRTKEIETAFSLFPRLWTLIIY